MKRSAKSTAERVADVLIDRVSAPPHPDQPLVFDRAGVIRFSSNSIVRFLLDNGRYDLNELVASTPPFPPDDWNQFMQLVGYSVSGYGDLDYIDRRRVRRADRKAEKLL